MDTPPAPPELADDAHKGDAGRVLAFVGSAWMPGAAILVARAAQRAGAGLVTLAIPDPALVAAIAPAAPEALFVPLAGAAVEHGRLPSAVRHVRADVRLVGSGRGNDDTTRALVRALVDDTFDGPLVVDADGLNAVAGEPERLAPARGTVVITPHPGEAERLLARTIGVTDLDRLIAAEELARRVRGVCALKGRGTVVSDGARSFVARTGNAGMATAGTGDVLAGIVAAYLCAVRFGNEARPFGPFEAVCAAVHAHGLAGDLAAAALGRRALVASDLITYLPAAQREHRARVSVS